MVRCAAIRYVSLDDRHTRDSSCSSLTLKLWHLLTGNKGELELGPETFEDKIGSYGGTSQERRIPLHRNLKRLEFGLCGREPTEVTPLSQEQSAIEVEISLIKLRAITRLLTSRR